MEQAFNIYIVHAALFITLKNFRLFES